MCFTSFKEKMTKGFISEGRKSPVKSADPQLKPYVDVLQIAALRCKSIQVSCISIKYSVILRRLNSLLMKD